MQIRPLRKYLIRLSYDARHPISRINDQTVVISSWRIPLCLISCFCSGRRDSASTSSHPLPIISRAEGCRWGSDAQRGDGGEGCERWGSADMIQAHSKTQEAKAILQPPLTRAAQQTFKIMSRYLQEMTHKEQLRVRLCWQSNQLPIQKRRSRPGLWSRLPIESLTLWTIIAHNTNRFWTWIKCEKRNPDIITKSPNSFKVSMRLWGASRVTSVSSVLSWGKSSLIFSLTQWDDKFNEVWTLWVQHSDRGLRKILGSTSVFPLQESLITSRWLLSALVL